MCLDYIICKFFTPYERDFRNSPHFQKGCEIKKAIGNVRDFVFDRVIKTCLDKMSRYPVRQINSQAIETLCLAYILANKNSDVRLPHILESN